MKKRVIQRYVVLFGGFVLGSSLAACGGQDSAKKTDDPPVLDHKSTPVATAASPTSTTKVTQGGSNTGASTAQVTATATATATTPPPAPADEKNGAGMANDGLPNDIPSTRSKVPTVAEWDAVTREIRVARSTPLGCETKMVREWVRISCRNHNDSGGKPTTVATKTAGGVEAYLFQKNNITSVVLPVLRGKYYDAVFSWTDKRQLLAVDWRSGNRPVIKFTDP